MADGRYRIDAQSTPERLKTIGPLIPGAWGRAEDELHREIRGDFLLDTGAYGAMIDLEVAELLHLPRQGSREVHGIHGYGVLPQFLAKVMLCAKDPGGQEGVFELVTECLGVPSLSDKSRQQNANMIGILGRVFLQSARLEVDGTSGKISLWLADPANTVVPV